MGTLMMDSGMRKKLGSLEDSLELTDEAGKVFAVVLSPEKYRLLAHRDAAVPFSEAEIARRRKEEGGRPLAEILKRLGAE